MIIYSSAMAESASDGRKKVESVVDQFVTVLGLVDIVFGGLLLYLFWRTTPSEASRLFPPTRHDLLDPLLLVSAAAVVGKAFMLLVDAVFALLSVVPLWEPQKKLIIDALKGQDIRQRDPIDVAMAFIGVSDATHLPRLDRMYANATFALGGGFIAGLTALAVTATPDLARGWWLALISIAAVLMIAGFFNFDSYYAAVADTASMVSKRSAPVSAAGPTTSTEATDARH